MIRSLSRGLRRGERRSLATAVALVAAVGLALTIGGCGGSSGGSSGSSSSSASKLQPPGSSIAINNAKHLAYVPNGTDVNGDGIIAVVNLAANPNNTNPVTKTITLTHLGTIVATVYDPVDGLLIVASDDFGTAGYLDVFKVSTLAPVSGSPFDYPSGFEPNYTGGIGLVSGKTIAQANTTLPNHDYAILSMCDTTSCSNGQFELFDLTLGVGAAVVPANYPEFAATNFNSGLTVNASDADNTGEIGIFDGAAGNACVLSDSNLAGDNDSAALDPSTDIAVVSNEDGTATVLNLNGGTFSTSSTPCTFTEAGTLPNSVQMTGLSTNLEGGIANPKTHQAFLVADGTSDLALISLPTAPVTQLSASMLSAQSTTMPNDPNGSGWSPSSNPSYVAINPKTNKAYTLSDGFLAQVDLAKFKSDPTTISAALPTTSQCGSSYGVTGTTAACSNAGNAVVFFPLTAP